MKIGVGYTRLKAKSSQLHLQLDRYFKEIELRGKMGILLIKGCGCLRHLSMPFSYFPSQTYILQCQKTRSPKEAVKIMIML